MKLFASANNSVDQKSGDKSGQLQMRVDVYHILNQPPIFAMPSDPDIGQLRSRISWVTLSSHDCGH
jgi:hypothetical protein